MSVLGLGLLFAQIAGVAPPRGDPTNLLTVSDRAQVEVRSVPGGPAAIDLDDGAVASLVSTHHDTTYNLAYSPHLSYLDIEGARNLALMHTARATMIWLSHRFRLTLSLDGSFGSQSAINFLTPVRFGDPTQTGSIPTGTPNGSVPNPLGSTTQPQLPVATASYIPVLGIITSASFRAASGVSYALSRRWTGALNGYYALAGGIDYASQQSLPPNRGPGGDVSLAYAATPRDTLITRVASAYVYVLTTKGSTWTVDATETFRHSFSPKLHGAVGGGLSYISEEIPASELLVNTVVPAAANGQPVPVPTGLVKSSGLAGNGQVSLGYTEPLRDNTTLALRCAAQYGTVFNPALGILQRDVTGSLASSWARHRVVLSLSVDGSVTLPSPDSLTSRVLAGTATVTYTPVKILQLQLGVRAYAELLPTLTETSTGQLVTSQGTTTAPQWATFVAASFLTPALQL